MKVCRYTAADDSRRMVLLFGLGLVGQAVETALIRQSSAQVCHFPCDWYEADLRTKQIKALEDVILAAVMHDKVARVDVLWLGGRSGFGSNDADMAAEYGIVSEIAELAERIHKRVLCRFHLLSSAGGLFEGAGHCAPQTAPMPLRAYGWGKLAQEKLVAELSAGLARRIYRPTSVYGYVPSGRMGLITALIGNGLKARTTSIFGRVATLRDYVTAADVGGFIASEAVRGSEREEGVFLLAAGQAVSMSEVIQQVENVLGQTLYLQFDPHPENAGDITFLRSCLPLRWNPTPLRTGIAQLFMKLYQQ